MGEGDFEAQNENKKGRELKSWSRYLWKLSLGVSICLDAISIESFNLDTGKE